MAFAQIQYSRARSPKSSHDLTNLRSMLRL